MEDQKTALNPDAEAETAETTTPVEEQTTKVESTTEGESKKGFSARVSEAVNRAKTAEAEAQSLRSKVAELTSQVGQPNFQATEPLKPLVNANEENVTFEELNRRQAERDQQILEQARRESYLQSQQALTLERISREARDLTRKYAELDPQSESFDPELSEVVSEAGLAYVKANPTKSLEEFVDKQMNLHKRAATKQAKAEQAEIANQTSQSAIRPTSAKPGIKKDEDMTIKEMEAKYGFGHD